MIHPCLFNPGPCKGRPQILQILEVEPIGALAAVNVAVVILERHVHSVEVV